MILAALHMLLCLLQLQVKEKMMMINDERSTDLYYLTWKNSLHHHKSLKVTGTRITPFVVYHQNSELRTIYSSNKDISLVNNGNRAFKYKTKKSKKRIRIVYKTNDTLISRTYLQRTT
jgi:hypothetical protein